MAGDRRELLLVELADAIAGDADGCRRNEENRHTIRDTSSRRSVVMSSIMAWPVVAGSDAAAHSAASCTCAGSVIIADREIAVWRARSPSDARMSASRMACAMGRMASAVASGFVSPGRKGTPSIVTMGPTRSGAVAASRRAMTPPRLCPTSTGRSSGRSPIYRRSAVWIAGRKGAPIAGSPANPASVRDMTRVHGLSGRRRARSKPPRTSLARE